MNAFLAYTKASRITGRQIAEAMGIPHGIRQPSPLPDNIIRWGSRRWMMGRRHTINWAAAIAKASDKVMALMLMQEAEIPTVEFALTWDEAIQAGDKIILGRRVSGMQGRDIRVYDPQRLYNGTYPKAPSKTHEWYSIYEKPTREVRIHVVDGNVIRVQGKYLDYPEQAGDNPFVRNFKSGYRYRTPAQELHSSRLHWAVRAVDVLGLDFGAVDMLLFGSQEECKILEVNTAPACSPLTVQKYADALTAML